MKARKKERKTKAARNKWMAFKVRGTVVLVTPMKLLSL